MRLAAVSIIRDEGDILEAWARHNLHFIDRLFIVDDGSTDNTSDILQALAAEGLSVSVTSGQSLAAFHQGRLTTSLVEYAMNEEAWDYVFLLDGDEFLVSDDRSMLESELGRLGSHQIGGLNPRHYVMSDEDDATQPCPLTRLTRVSVHEPYVFKVVIPGRLATEKGFSVVDGNHAIAKWGVRLPSTILPGIELAHFPARSEAQLVGKGLAAYIRWSARTDFGGGHPPDRLQEGIGVLKEQSDLRITALDRLCHALGSERHDGGDRYQPFVERRGEIRYLELAKTFPYRRAVSACDDLVRAFKATLRENDQLREKEETLQSWIRRTLRKHRQSIMRRVSAFRAVNDSSETQRG